MNRIAHSRLDLENCPQCQVTKPLLTKLWDSIGHNEIDGGWAVYQCSKCLRMILAHAPDYEEIQQIWPKQKVLSDDIPPRARKTLGEAIKIVNIAPPSSIMT